MNANLLIESGLLLIGVLLQPTVVVSADDWTLKMFTNFLFFIIPWR